MAPSLVKSVHSRLATKEDDDIPWFDNTKLTAVNTCPTWGIVRHIHNRVVSGSGRAMALEAGAACHEVFAAARLYDLLIYQKLPDHFEYHGNRIFGERFDDLKQWLGKGDDQRIEGQNFCLEALYTSGYHDDPYDKRRTLANLEQACLAYLDAWPWGVHPIWVSDAQEPTATIGIENGINIVITFSVYDSRFDDVFDHSYRLVGRVDGIHVHDDGIAIHENKTASRLNEAWSESFQMSHQVTGYMLAASLMTGQPITSAYVHGLAIPQPKYSDFGGIAREYVTRSTDAFAHWFNWFWYTTQTVEQYKDNWMDAPRFTHSCNRYFRPCSFLPLCAAPTDEERQDAYNEMVHDAWDPLEGDNE